MYLGSNPSFKHVLSNKADIFLFNTFSDLGWWNKYQGWSSFIFSRSSFDRFQVGIGRFSRTIGKRIYWFIIIKEKELIAIKERHTYMHEKDFLSMVQFWVLYVQVQSSNNNNETKIPFHNLFFNRCFQDQESLSLNFSSEQHDLRKFKTRDHHFLTLKWF